MAESERRAFKQAVFAVHDQHVALDIVQDSMLKLAEKYSARPVEELPLLFQRILQNVIRDFFRRQKVRSTWTTLFSSFSSKDEDDYDVLETIESKSGPSHFASADESLQRSQVNAAVEAALQSLPARQREAFVLRYWEEMDVAETASIMGCSEGTVKTHCSRATDALAKILKAKGIEL